MPSSRIFVSYVCVGDEQGAKVGKQLVSDIRAAHTEAVADHETIPDDRFMAFLMRELPQCSCLIVVQTPVAMQAWRVQNTLALASALVAQRRLRAIRVIAVPSQNTDNQLLWTALTPFDASMDYPRARERLFLALGLTQVDADDSFIIHQPIAVSRPSVPSGAHLPPQPSGPISRPVGSMWPAQPSGPMSVSGGTSWPDASAPLPAPGGTSWPAQPSVPISMPGGGTNWPAQPSVPMPVSGGTNWPTQPSVPIPVSGGTNWPAQPSAPISAPGGTSWPAQPSAPMHAPGETSWPGQPPVSQPGFAAPVSYPGLPPSRLPGPPASQQKNQPGLAPKQAWSRMLGFFTRPLQTSQTSIAAHQPGMSFFEDRPQSLGSTRRTIVRWVIVTGILLILILVVTLIVLLVRNHMHLPGLTR